MNTNSIALMMEAEITSETSVNFYQTTRRNIPDDSYLQREYYFSIYVFHKTVPVFKIYILFECSAHHKSCIRSYMFYVRRATNRAHIEVIGPTPKINQKVFLFVGQNFLSYLFAFNTLKPNGNICTTCCNNQSSFRFVHRVYLWISYESQSSQRLLP
jgi:hypothetical protein